MTSSMDDDFELLVNQKDFIKLEQQNKRISEENKKLKLQKQKIKDELVKICNLYDISMKKNIKLQSDIKYLSNQSIKLAQKLMESDQALEKIKENVLIMQVKFAKEYEGSLKINKQLEKKRYLLQEQIKEARKLIEKERKADQSQLKSTNYQKQIKKNENKFEETIKLKDKQIIQLLQTIEQLQSQNKKLNIQLSQFQNCYIRVEDFTCKFQFQQKIQRLQCQLANQKKRNSKLQQNLNKFQVQMLSHKYIANQQNKQKQFMLKKVQDLQKSKIQMKEQYQKVIRQYEIIDSKTQNKIFAQIRKYLYQSLSGIDDFRKQKQISEHFNIIIQNIISNIFGIKKQIIQQIKYANYHKTYKNKK